MLVDAPFANKTGRSYGNGIYFADILDKSLGYSNGDYVLLCDVELGACKVSWSWTLLAKCLVNLSWMLSLIYRNGNMILKQRNKEKTVFWLRESTFLIQNWSSKPVKVSKFHLEE